MKKSDYARLKNVKVPFLMYFHQPNYISTAVHTDMFGFRIQENIQNDKPTNLMFGGSAVFGVGASSDNSTITYYLSDLVNENWINCGGRAFSSTQEILLYILMMQPKINPKKIIVYSGINNLILFYMTRYYPVDYGSTFAMTDYYNIKDPGFNDCYTRIVVHDKQKDLILHTLERDILTWKKLSMNNGFNVYYVLQGWVSWADKKLTGEEEKINASKTLSCFDEISKRDIYLWYKERLNQICDWHGLPFMDINEYFSDYSDDTLFIDKVHMTDTGNKVIANILKEKLCL